MDKFLCITHLKLFSQDCKIMLYRKARPKTARKKELIALVRKTRSIGDQKPAVAALVCAGSMLVLIISALCIPIVSAEETKLAQAGQSNAGEFAEAEMRPASPTDQSTSASSNELLRRGLDSMSKQMFEAAARDFREVVRREPDNVAASNNLAVALKKGGQLEEAIEEYKKAIALHPSRAELYNNLASTYLSQGDFEKAMKALYQAIHLKPDYPNARYNLAHVLYLTDNYEGAIEQYQEALNLEPNSSIVHRDLGDALRAHGQPKQALIEFRNAQRLGDTSIPLLLRISRTQKDLGDLAVAKETLAQALAKDEKNTEVINMMGIIAWKGNHLQDAIALFERALDLDPKFPQARNNLGIVFYLLHRYEDAVAVWRQALTIKPDYAEVHYNMGSALLRAGLNKQAAEAYAESIRFHPYDAKAHNNRGLALAKMGDHKEALAEWRKALQLDPDLGAAHVNLGRALMKDQPQGQEDIHESG